MNRTGNTTTGMTRCSRLKLVVETASVPNIHARLVIKANSVEGLRILEKRMLQADEAVAQMTKICVHEGSRKSPAVKASDEHSKGIVTALRTLASRLPIINVATVNHTIVSVVAIGIGSAV